MSAMPAQKPGRSVQDYQTQPEFLAAVKHRLGISSFAIDLAADESNAVADLYYDVAQNSLRQPWNPITAPWSLHIGGWGFCNMPFGTIAPWVEKAWWESRLPGPAAAQSALLVPAGVGANWWRDWVHHKARVLLLNGRLTFVGQPTCYPKDCCLLLYGPGIIPDYEVWTWPQELTR